MKMKYFISAIFLLSLCAVFMSCDPDRQGVEDRKLIEDYLADNNLQAEKLSSGLYYIITVPGNNEHPTQSDTVTINYTGSLLNGSVFDSNPSANFRLGDLIEGM